MALLDRVVVFLGRIVKGIGRSDVILQLQRGLS